MSSIGKGYIQIYTGDGKGKTTASVGLCLRALGAGLRVCYVQFIKGTPSSEFRLLLTLPEDQFCYRAFGLSHFIIGTPDPADIQVAHEGLLFVGQRLEARDYDVVILDESLGAVGAGLFTTCDLLNLCKCKPEGIELVFTGRNAPEALIERADLVSRIDAVKHYYETQHLNARKGIES